MAEWNLLITGFRRIRIIWHCLYLYRDIFTKPIMKKISENTYGNAPSGFLFLRICGIYFTVVWFAFLGLFGFTIGAKPDLYNLFVMPFVDGEAFQYNLGSWFVYPLFLVCIINVLFRKFLKLIHLDNEFIVLIVYLAIGMIGINTAIENPTAINGIVKLFVRTMFFLPCYEFGRFYKAVLEKKDTLNNVAYFAIIFAVQLILLTFCENLEYTPSSFTNFNNGFVIPYISSIIAIAFWLRVSRLLVPAIGNSKLVRLIADNTYGIMVNQLVGFMCLKFVFYGLSCITSGSLFGDFNVASFKSSIWYYYLPNGLQQWAFVYLIFGLFVPILISIILNKICNIVHSSSYLKKI